MYTSISFMHQCLSSHQARLCQATIKGPPVRGAHGSHHAESTRLLPPKREARSIPKDEISLMLYRCTVLSVERMKSRKAGSVEDRRLRIRLKGRYKESSAYDDANRNFPTAKARTVTTKPTTIIVESIIAISFFMIAGWNRFSANESHWRLSQ
uniref:Uncharacterized protein n=1 Tax=Anopheles farauti TaxID=69004 RepID=A0A182Q5J6_9DIPT